MLLELTHETHFRYDHPVGEVYVELRLTPLTDGSQHLLQHRQRTQPSRPVRQFVDAWGNAVSYFNVLSPVDAMEVVFDSVVETRPEQFRGQPLPDSDFTSPAARLVLFDYLRPTELTTDGADLNRFILPLERLRGEPVQNAAEEIRETIYGSFRYDGDATSATSTVADLLRAGAGVCQDFTHLMLATCRRLGFAARYVSGYVLPEVEGEVQAASHAWCEVFDPASGWLGVDPTHNCWTGERYVRLGVGRDYHDVAPNRGLYRGSAHEEMEVRVRLRPITTEELESRARAMFPQPRVIRVSPSSAKSAPAKVPQTLYAHQKQQQQQ